MKSLLSLVFAVLLAGCSSTNRNLIVTTGTIIGVEVAENPTTGLYQAKLGYGRVEFALVPTQTNGVTPNIIMELKYHGLWSREGGVYQRLAIGDVACSQAAAALLFGKDSKGNMLTNVLPIIQNYKVKPLTNAANKSGD